MLLTGVDHTMWRSLNSARQDALAKVSSYPTKEIGMMTAVHGRAEVCGCLARMRVVGSTWSMWVIGEASEDEVDHKDGANDAPSRALCMNELPPLSEMLAEYSA